MDHTVTDQTSIIRFIEDNWLGGQRIGNGSFDALAGSLNTMFNFRNPRNQGMYILDPTTGEVAPAGVGRRAHRIHSGVAQTSAAPGSIESAGRDRVLITRRNFLKHSSLTLASLAVNNPKSEASDAATLDPGSLKPFVDALPIPTVAQPAASRPNPEDLKQSVPVYEMVMRETRVKVHRDLSPTRMWTIGGSFPGVTIETNSGHAVQVNWKNQLPAQHFLPIDYTLHGAERNVPEVRSVIHLHGGRTPAASDGYPEEWIVPGKTQTCFYPSQQEAALLFYHDHTMGINRLNIYAGMQGFFIVRDDVEEQLHVPKGKYEIPLMFCDRLLRTDGQLFYPVSENPKAPWVPEVFGNAILVNGKLLPYLNVEPRKYRFRLMNGSNGRFYRFSLQNKAEFHMIGSDQGLLASPVALTRLPLAPAERGDIIIDFQPDEGRDRGVAQRLIFHSAISRGSRFGVRRKRSAFEHPSGAANPGE